MLKLAIENCGTQLALYMMSDNETEIQERFYSLWNHGATSGKLHWINDDLANGDLKAYIWTQPEKLEKAVTNAMLFKLLNEAEAHGEAGRVAIKGLKGGLMPRARELAAEFMESIKSVKNWWRYQAQTEVFELGSICAESLDGPSVHTDWNTSHRSMLNTYKD